MKHQRNSVLDSMMRMRSPPRVAVVGGGIAGLTCARELSLRGCELVVFEADIRLGGRCSSRSTPVGLFDDAAQCIGGASRLASYAVQRPGELAALHPWTVPAPPAEDESNGAWLKDEDEADVARALTPVGAVGVPSMRALADALARPLDYRLNTPILQARRVRSQWALRGSTGVIEEDFQALVLALPAPVAIPLAQESSGLADALRAVRYRSRWVLLLGSERPVARGLDPLGEFGHPRSFRVRRHPRGALMLPSRLPSMRPSMQRSNPPTISARVASRRGREPYDLMKTIACAS